MSTVVTVDVFAINYGKYSTMMDDIEVQDEYKQKCSRYDCESVRFDYQTHENFDEDGFLSQLPKREISFRILPKFTLVDLVMYMTSVFGFWLGFAMPMTLALLSRMTYIFLGADDVPGGSWWTNLKRKMPIVVQYLLTLLILIGFAWQCYDSIGKYLLYMTVTGTQVDTLHFHPASLSVCHRLGHILQPTSSIPEMCKDKAQLDA